MFYVKWFGQVMLVMVLTGVVALLVPPPAIAGLLLIVVIVWSCWLLTSLARHLARPSIVAAESPAPERVADLGLGVQVVTGNRAIGTESFARPPVAQRVKAGSGPSTQRPCSRIRPRMPREPRGRSFPPSFIYCRARRRLPAA